MDGRLKGEGGGGGGRIGVEEVDDVKNSIEVCTMAWCRYVHVCRCVCTFATCGCV